MAYEGGKLGREFADLEIVQEHITRAANYLGEVAVRDFLLSGNGVLRYMCKDRFDSPLEVLFWVWWEALVAQSEAVRDDFKLVPQAEIAIGTQRFRFDFLIEPLNRTGLLAKGWRLLAVELDGHGFHERSKEQVINRDQRDRAVQMNDWKVFHFSFTEFTTQPADCVCEVLMFARQQWNQLTWERVAPVVDPVPIS